MIPAFLVLYIVMLPLNALIEDDHGEIFPFFSWRLFTRVPDWYTTEYGLLVHSVEGLEVDEPFYLIPSDDIRDWKALSQAVKACTTSGNCDQTVTETLYPIVFHSLETRNVEFSIIEARIDLRDIQDRIDDIATTAINKTEFFQPGNTIGRWHTQTGRMDG